MNILLVLELKFPDYSSVGRASDCRKFAGIRWSLVRFRVAGFEKRELKIDGELSRGDVLNVET